MSMSCVATFFFFNDTATTEIYTLSLHDALPIFGDIPDNYKNQTADNEEEGWRYTQGDKNARRPPELLTRDHVARCIVRERSEEHTSELQSRQYLVCRLLLEKKKTTTTYSTHTHL